MRGCSADSRSVRLWRRRRWLQPFSVWAPGCRGPHCEAIGQLPGDDVPYDSQRPPKEHHGRILSGRPTMYGLCEVAGELERTEERIAVRNALQVEDI